MDPDFSINQDDASCWPRDTMADWAQAAEILHAEDGITRHVTALKDCPHGLFHKGDVVYTSEGPVD